MELGRSVCKLFKSVTSVCRKLMCGVRRSVKYVSCAVLMGSSCWSILMVCASISYSVSNFELMLEFGLSKITVVLPLVLRDCQLLTIDDLPSPDGMAILNGLSELSACSIRLVIAATDVSEWRVVYCLHGL